ncbi:hypothetical protein PPYR_09104 [Photinus pyralis]|uniref:UPAR/Ly6 domain-containing protein n=2 Tax=Photinus pyralis TaxID=7054 RepID=A0A5N4ALB2_PHOPY|nr:uncharacterized protein LOC116171588 [Photinus pyralis]KAB0798111.1 hypothetical protein PPYR_09104 [Photinus pyralis]
MARRYRNNGPRKAVIFRSERGGACIVLGARAMKITVTLKLFLSLQVDMLRISMLLSCIFMTNPALDDRILQAANLSKREISDDFDKYAVTCYICVNVSDNLVCNQFAIDRPCKPGETFCHTLHIMDSKGNSVLVNKKCTTEKECQRTKVGCVEIDMQTMCVACCDQNYCNVNVPTNTSNAIYDDKISKMRMLAKNLFREREKALTTTIKEGAAPRRLPLVFTHLIVISIFVNYYRFLL